MRKVAIFLKLPEILDYPFSKQVYRQAYFELSEAIVAAGGQPYIVRGQASYVGNGKFSRSWQYDGLTNFRETGELQADVIFDRGYFEPDNTIPVFNPAGINQVCTDKWEMYRLFPEYCAKTFEVASQAELHMALPQITTKLAVIKPIDGEEGQGVQIMPVAEMDKVKTAYPILLQEFLDSSGGVPGIMAGLHDFRVALLNGKIVYSYYRTPPPGSYLANVARGGHYTVVKVADIPVSMKEVVAQVDAKLAQYGPRFYGIDFAMTPTGPKIIEMNSRLGLDENSDGPEFVQLKKDLATVLLQLAGGK